MTQMTPPPRKLRSVNAAPSFAAPRAIMALIMREMASTYGRSFGGYAWVLLEPICGIGLLALIFSSGFRSPALGTNFAMFYATGLLPFLMYVSISGKVSQSISFSRQLLSYPRVSYIDTILARFILATLTHLLISYILLISIVSIWDTRTVIDLPHVLLSFTMAAVLGLGIGLLNCPLTMQFPVWQSIWGIINRPIVLISNVIFLIDNIPEPYRGWLLWNPLVHVVGMSRRAFYYSYEAPYIDVGYVFLVALIAAALGLVLLHRNYRDLLEL